MNEWITLIELREGAIFATESGCIAVKSEYFYGNERDSQCQCVLIETGEYAHFLNGNKQLVKEIDLSRIATLEKIAAAANKYCREDLKDEDFETLILAVDELEFGSVAAFKAREAKG